METLSLLRSWLGRAGRAQSFDDCPELTQRRSVFGADGRILAARIRALQRSAHRARDGNRIAAVIVVAHQIEFGVGLDVAGEAVAAESIVHFLKSAGTDR